jgi:hypothetical protein
VCVSVDGEDEDDLHQRRYDDDVAMFHLMTTVCTCVTTRTQYYDDDVAMLPTSCKCL